MAGKHYDLDTFRVKPASHVSLDDFATKYEGGDELDKQKADQLTTKSIEKLRVLQDKLYAHNRYSILIILQGMDTSGKDSVVRHVISGLNPAGVRVTSFKVPTQAELDHDYIWRHYLALPARGEIGIFNRSHDENVIATKVHPENILKEQLPNIDSLKDIDAEFWEKRYRQINRFEKTLFENGTIILKFFLHLSRDEQKKRLLERINNPEKNWKFSIADMKERTFWKEYKHAYEECFTKTSTDHAPWFIVPADNKWFTHLLVSRIICNEFTKLNILYPSLNREQQEELEKAKTELLNEE